MPKGENNIKQSIVDVYFAQIPEKDAFADLYPPLRQIEIARAQNAKVKRQKYYVWKLFQYAVELRLQKPITQLSFGKSQTGKWNCADCEFSLSHSGDVVCVAVSQTPVGVDIQKIQPLKADISRKILSTAEETTFSTLPQAEKEDFLLKAWTNKESIFKAKNTKAISVEDFKALTGEVWQKKVCVGGAEYFLSVSAEHLDGVVLHEEVQL